MIISNNKEYTITEIHKKSRIFCHLNSDYKKVSYKFDSKIFDTLKEVFDYIKTTKIHTRDIIIKNNLNEFIIVQNILNLGFEKIKTSVESKNIIHTTYKIEKYTFYFYKNNDTELEITRDIKDAKKHSSIEDAKAWLKTMNDRNTWSIAE